MRVETIRSNGPGLWEIGVSGVQTERFRRVILTLAEIGKLQVAQPAFSYNADGRLLRVGIQAYSLGIAYELGSVPACRRCRSPLKFTKGVYGVVDEVIDVANSWLLHRIR